MSTSNSEKIGVSTATIIGMNAMIGAGIFAIPSTLATEVGPAGIISFAFMAISVWFMAQSVSRVAQLFPQEGSFYTYARQWGGHTAGIVASGCYLVGLLIAMGLLTHSAGQHLVRYLPDFTPHTLGLITLATLTTLNMIGVSLSSLGQQILIILTVLPLLLTTGICLTKASLTNLVPFMPAGPLSVFKATRIVAFSFFGFEASASLFDIIKDPERNVPRALTYSLMGVAALYLTFVSSLILAVPLSLFKANPGPASGALSIIFPDYPWAIECIHIASISAILGTLHSMIWSAGALFLSFVKKIHSKNSQFILAHGIMNHATATLCIGLAIFTSYTIFTNEMFFNLTALFLLIAYASAMITLLKIEQEWKSGQNYITCAGLTTAVVVFYFAVTDIIGALHF